MVSYSAIVYGESHQCMLFETDGDGIPIVVLENVHNFGFPNDSRLCLFDEAGKLVANIHNVMQIAKHWN